MSTTHARPVTETPVTNKEDAHAVVTEELSAFLKLLRGLEPSDWNKPTDCVAWSVRDVVAHVAGAFEDGARITVFIRHFTRAGKKHPDMNLIDAVNQMQLDERGRHGPSALIEELSVIGPKAISARRGRPQLMRRRTVPSQGTLPPGATFGYLFDVIYARDLWMHRIDIVNATGTVLAVTDAETEIVEQVVRDLGEVWDGPTSTLTLTGHGAGSWQLGAGVPKAELSADAVETCRMLSGRVASPTITSTGDPRALQGLNSSRVIF